MIKFIWDEGFKRSYKKRITTNSALKRKFWIAVNLFTENSFDAKLKTHKLTGKLSGLWALSVAYDCRVVFKFIENNNTVLLIDIGSHNEVY